MSSVKHFLFYAKKTHYYYLFHYIFYFMPLEIKSFELLRYFNFWEQISFHSDIPVLALAFFEDDEKMTFQLIWESYFPSLPGIGSPYLSLCEVQVDGDLVATEPGQVVVVGELGFQLSQLLLGERRALFPGLAAGVHLKTGLLDICRDTETKKCFAFCTLFLSCLFVKRNIKCFLKRFTWCIFILYSFCSKVS